MEGRARRRDVWTIEGLDEWTAKRLDD